MKKKFFAFILLLTLAAAVLAACSASPDELLNGRMVNLSANAAYDNGGEQSGKLSSCKGEGDGGFTVIFNGEKTFNRAYIALSGDAEISLSVNGEVLYRGAQGYITLPSVKAAELEVGVSCEGKWKAESLGIYNAPSASKLPAVSVNAEKVLDGALSAADFANVSAVILRANVLYDTDGTVHFANVGGTDGEEYFSSCVSALKNLTSAPVYMQADVMYTEGKDPVAEASHLRYTALRTNSRSTAVNLNAVVKKYGLQGLHIDFSDSATDGTSLYLMGEFAPLWKSVSGGSLSAAMRLEGMERSEKTDKLITDIFRDGAMGNGAVRLLILKADEVTYASAAEFAGMKSVFPIALALDCATDARLFAYASDCGISCALLNFDKSGADAVNSAV